MRILFVTNLFPPHYLGGYELLCHQVVHAFAAGGHRVSVLTSTHESGLGAETEDGVRVFRELRLETPFDGEPDPSRRNRLRIGRHNERVTSRVLAAENPEVVFLWSQLRLTMGCARAAQASGRCTVVTFNDDHWATFVPSPLDSWRPNRIGRWITDRTLHRRATLSGLALDRSTCISKCLKNILLDKGVPVWNARVIYQGIPIERFPSKEVPGLLHSPLRLLYVGQLHRYKGVHTLVKAVSALAGTEPVCATIVGDGDPKYRAELARTSEGLPLVLRGKARHDELPAIYREHDVFVFPSTWKEPFGLTHLEAMASGTTVISTTEGGHGELMQDGVNGLVFEKERPDQLAQHIRRLLANPAMSRQLAVHAREIVEREFSLARYVADLEVFVAEAQAGGLP